MTDQEIYLRAILATVARQTFPPAQLSELVGSGEKQLSAYNMCDGTRAQSEIAKALSLDPGNFSRSLSRWVDLGIVIKVGDGRDMRPVHVYPLPSSTLKKAKSANGDKE